jgi:hypothetical protein
MSEIKYTEADLEEAEEMAQKKGYEKGLSEGMAKIGKLEGGFQLPKAMNEDEVRGTIKSLFETVTEFTCVADLLYERGHNAGYLKALTPRPIDEFKEGVELLGYQVGYDWTGKLKMNFLGVVKKEDWEHELTHALEIPKNIPTPTPL